MEVFDESPHFRQVRANMVAHVLRYYLWLVRLSYLCFGRVRSVRLFITSIVIQFVLGVGRGKLILFIQIDIEIILEVYLPLDNLLTHLFDPTHLHCCLRLDQLVSLNLFPFFE